jgi:hypothetical protein
MPKLTVYVREGLVERVRELNRDVNVSALLQRALQAETERLTSEQRRAARIREKVDMSTLRERFQAARDEAYEEGYSFALEVAGDLDYIGFEELEHLEWDPDTVWERLYHARYAVDERPSKAYMRGLAAALRDVWETVHDELNKE